MRVLHEVPTVTKFKCSLLVVDDEPYILATLAALLSTEFEVVTADTGEAAKAILEQREVDIILSDPLTGLPNRRAMDRLSERELRRRDRYPSPLALGLIDVDHFKQINSHFLLPGGDRVLVDLARCLGASLRNVDLMGRIGGEEFLVIAPETSLDGASVLAERIRVNVEKHPFQYQDSIIA